MTRRGTRHGGHGGLTAVVIATTLGLAPGCKKDETSGDEGTPTSKPSDRDRSSRIGSPDLEKIGRQPGFLEDGPIFAAFRVQAAQQFLQQMPLPGEVTRDLARARGELGFDIVNDDLEERLGIPKDAIISMTIARPVGMDHHDDVRNGLRRDSRFLTALARTIREEEENSDRLWNRYRREYDYDFKEEAKKADAYDYYDEKKEEKAVEVYPEYPPPLPEAKAAPIMYTPPMPVEELFEEEEPIEEELFAEEPLVEEEPPFGVPGGVVGGVPGGAFGMPYDPGPPPLSPGERREIDELLGHADAMALQFRFHIPTNDPEKIVALFRAEADEQDLRHGEELCKDVAKKVELCLANSGRDVVLLHRDGKALNIDVVSFSSRRGAAPERLRPVIAEALKADESKHAALKKISGHAAAYLDADALVAMFDHEELGKSMRRLTWDDYPSNVLERYERKSKALRDLFDVPRLFEGLVVQAHHERDHTQMTATWRLRDDQEDLAKETLSPPPIVVPVPTIEALCEGALMCARSRGLPNPEGLGTKLALGPYADPRVFEDTVDEIDEEAITLLLVSTWPNALGTGLWHLPQKEAGRGPEAAMVRGLVGSVARVQGLGMSVRSLDVRRRELKAEYAAYARVRASDMSVVGTLLSFAGQHMSAVTLDGVEGTIEMLRIPEDDVPAVLMTRTDPEAVKVDGEDEKITHGWLTMVDDQTRLAWLLGLSTDDGEDPMIYWEVPDLWRFISSFPDGADELAFARTWANDRTIKAELVLDKGEPTLRFDASLATSDDKSAR